VGVRYQVWSESDHQALEIGEGAFAPTLPPEKVRATLL